MGGAARRLPNGRIMKRIEAIVRPSVVSEIRKALRDANLFGVTVTQVKGQGREEDQTEIYRGGEYDASLRHHSKMEVVVGDCEAQEVIDLIVDLSRSGQAGDGKIFVSEVTEVIRIRNGQRDEAAV